MQAVIVGLAVGAPGFHQHGATERIAAEQRALRPFQHFDRGDIEKGIAALRRPDPVDAIDKHADRHRLGAIGIFGIGAAQGQLEIVAALGKGQPRGNQRQARHIVNAGAIQGFAAEHIDRFTHILGRFFPLGGGDDDFFERG